MEHWVQYRNPDRMGRSSGAGNDDVDDDDVASFSILSAKPVERLVGNTVWLIAGEGRPRRYALRQVFVVDEVGPADEVGFRYVARGSQGTRFEPPIPLGPELWFRDLVRRLGSFAFGLSRVPDDLLPCLQALHADAGERATGPAPT